MLQQTICADYGVMPDRDSSDETGTGINNYTIFQNRIIPVAAFPCSKRYMLI